MKDLYGHSLTYIHRHSASFISKTGECIFVYCVRSLYLIESFLQPCGEVQIVEDDVPLRTPRDAFGKLVPLSKLQGSSPLSTMSLSTPLRDMDAQSVANSEESFESALSPSEKRLHYYSVVDSIFYNSASSDDDQLVSTPDIQSSGSNPYISRSIGCLASDHDDEKEDGQSSISKTPVSQGKGQKQNRLASFRENTDLSRFRMAPRSFWPFWVYRMYDSYYLAQRAAGKFLICFDHFLEVAHT